MATVKPGTNLEHLPLTEVLRIYGLWHRKSDVGVYRHDVLNLDDQVVFCGNAAACFDWLRQTGRFPVYAPEARR
jgi:hypothetical protein